MPALDADLQSPHYLMDQEITSLFKAVFSNSPLLAAQCHS